jgi:hypothetical protein
MPAEDISPFLPQGRVHWEELEELKRVWGVSLQALIVRAHRLGRISDHSYQQAFRHISREGWRRNEPVNLGPPEEPQLLARAFTLLAKKGLTPEEVLHELALPESLARLAEVSDSADEAGASVVPLKPRPLTAPAAPERRVSAD